MESCTLCEVWSAHQALRLGLINDLAPVYREDGEWINNPKVITDRWTDEQGRIVYGDRLIGEAAQAAKQRLADSR